MSIFKCPRLKNIYTPSPLLKMPEFIKYTAYHLEKPPCSSAVFTN